MRVYVERSTQWKWSIAAAVTSAAARSAAPTAPQLPALLLPTRPAVASAPLFTIGNAGSFEAAAVEAFFEFFVVKVEAAAVEPLGVFVFFVEVVAPVEELVGFVVVDVEAVVAGVALEVLVGFGVVVVVEVEVVAPVEALVGFLVVDVEVVVAVVALEVLVGFGVVKAAAAAPDEAFVALPT